MQKRVNKILWHGDELENGAAKKPAVAEAADGLDGLNRGELYICDADEDPAIMIRTASGEVVRIGGADLEVLRKYFLRKDKEDSTGFLTTFLKGIVFGKDGFASGMAGFGGKLDERGYGEMRGLTLWEWLQVPELRYNRVEVVIGDKWRSPGAGIIESCVPDKDADGNNTDTGTCTLKLESGEYGAVAVDDICMGIWHFGDERDATEDSDDGIGNFTFAGFATSYFRITEVSGEDNGTFRYSLRPGYTVHPQAQMHFTCRGNFTNEERQTSVYETRTYTRMLWKQNTWEFGKGNVALQYGDLSNLNVFGLNMTGYSMYLNSVYFTGTILQTKPDGTPVRTANDRGAWEAGHYDYYDRVSHDGCLWLCVNESGTDSEPSETSADWLKQVDKGEQGASASNLGEWQSEILVPYLGIVRMGDASWQCINPNGTTNPPLWCWLDQNGNYLTYSDGGYVLTGEENTGEYELVARDGEQGIPGLQGLQGEQGIPGTPGADGKTSYFHIKYSNDGGKTFTGNNGEDTGDYLGTYVDFTEEDSADVSSYKWQLTKGAQGEKGDQGIPGTNGANGQTSYLHIAYAMSEDGSQGFSVSDSSGKLYIGQYTDFTQADSTDYRLYSWTKIKGEQGDKGDKGDQGDSVSNLGEWKSGMLVPYLGIVRMSGASWQCVVKNGTSNPPLWCWLDQNGNYLTYSDGSYALTGEKNTSDYELVAEDGKDGESIKGDPGIQGCIIRRGEWAIGVEWRNDESLTSGTRFLDVAMVRDNTTATGWRAYKCKVTHTSSASNAPGTSGGATYWEEFGVNVTSIFTSLIIAKNASIDLFQGNQVVVKNDSGEVEAGLTGLGITGNTDVRIFAGPITNGKAPTMIDKYGRIYSRLGMFYGSIATPFSFFNVSNLPTASFNGDSGIITVGSSESYTLLVDERLFEEVNGVRFSIMFRISGTLPLSPRASIGLWGSDTWPTCIVANGVTLRGKSIGVDKSCIIELMWAPKVVNSTSIHKRADLYILNYDASFMKITDWEDSRFTTIPPEEDLIQI